jgi:hypothetical protein
MFKDLLAGMCPDVGGMCPDVAAVATAAVV